VTDPTHEKPQALAHWVLPTLASAAILAAIGAIGLVAHDAWLVPSLGSAIFVQVMTPKEPSAHWWNSLVGQIIAVPAGFLGVYVTRAQAAPEFLSGHPLEPIRLAAVAVAIAATVLAQRGLKATCPAGGAVALLIALGTVPPDLHGAALLGIGILLVTLLGEPARLLILRAA
jgi:hypothetical protein